MPDYKVSIGNAEVISLTDGKGRAAATDVFPNVPASEWDRYPGARGADGKLDINFGSFVVRSQGVTILVDTGWGPGYPGVLLDELREKGIGVDEIGVVAITHIHPDHVGWNVIEENGKARLTFPKARYLIPKGDYDHFRQRHELEKAPHMTSQVLALDVDSGNPTVDDLLADPFISSYGTFIYPTISWTPDNRKSRSNYVP